MEKIDCFIPYNGILEFFEIVIYTWFLARNMYVSNPILREFYFFHFSL